MVGRWVPGNGGVPPHFTKFRKFVNFANFANFVNFANFALSPAPLLGGWGGGGCPGVEGWHQIPRLRSIII